MALKELTEFCDFCSHCIDDRLRDRIVTGIRSEETVRLLLAEPALTLQKTIDICRAKENTMQNSAELRGSFAYVHAAWTEPGQQMPLGRSRRKKQPAPTRQSGRARNTAKASHTTRRIAQSRRAMWILWRKMAPQGAAGVMPSEEHDLWIVRHQRTLHIGLQESQTGQRRDRLRSTDVR